MMTLMDLPLVERGAMRMSVDGEQCMGHGRCYRLMPDLLQLRRRGLCHDPRSDDRGARRSAASRRERRRAPPQGSDLADHRSAAVNRADLSSARMIGTRFRRAIVPAPRQATRGQNETTVSNGRPRASSKREGITSPPPPRTSASTGTRTQSGRTLRAAVGIGSTALYHYFESKLHCLYVIMADALESFHSDFERITSESRRLPRRAGHRAALVIRPERPGSSAQPTARCEQGLIGIPRHLAVKRKLVSSPGREHAISNSRGRRSSCAEWNRAIPAGRARL